MRPKISDSHSFTSFEDVSVVDRFRGFVISCIDNQNSRMKQENDS